MNGQSEGVTNINDLPNSENVKLSIEDKNNPSVNMNEIFKEIQTTGTGGNLPSRDIPINTNNVSMDHTSKPNYIPKHEDYIDETEMEDMNEIVETKRKETNKKDSLEILYEELQVPILLGVIYFVFQMPVFNEMMAKYLSFSFHADGGINLSGIVLKSVMFAGIYFVLTKCIHNISE